MNKLYVNLLGSWTEIKDGSVIDNSYDCVSSWIEEMLPSLFAYDYINIEHNGKEYRVHPTHIQIVSE